MHSAISILNTLDKLCDNELRAHAAIYSTNSVRMNNSYIESAGWSSCEFLIFFNVFCILCLVLLYLCVFCCDIWVHFLFVLPVLSDLCVSFFRVMIVKGIMSFWGECLCISRLYMLCLTCVFVFYCVCVC